MLVDAPTNAIVSLFVLQSNLPGTLECPEDWIVGLASN
ncbi:hypothetical protein CEV34_3039 [Brucella pseudogrignonensis]|uniref:Uncharacterized protein n=1 Tax=Brucella pseudogrignonensis TaxID=419475 RepID=A0A256GDU9_9HYPH|nr:hypothetical protein CEV34_3039 [Brucella pseudogrignonensis]